MPEENYRNRRTLDDPDMYDNEITRVQVSELVFEGTAKPMPLVLLGLEPDVIEIWLTKLDILMLAKEVGITANDFNG